MKNNNTGFGEKTKKVTQASKFELSTSYPQGGRRQKLASFNLSNF